eukprot:275344-Rhodomonas_salina.1
MSLRATAPDRVACVCVVCDSDAFACLVCDHDASGTGTDCRPGLRRRVTGTHNLNLKSTAFSSFKVQPDSDALVPSPGMRCSVIRFGKQSNDTAKSSTRDRNTAANCAENLVSCV